MLAIWRHIGDMEARRDADRTEIRDAKPGTKAVILRDREVAGFGVRVAPGGVKSYVLDYRVNGRRRLATLARCSEINLKGSAGEGGPRACRHPGGRSGPLERRREALAAPTVAELIERFLAVEAPARIERRAHDGAHAL